MKTMSFTAACNEFFGRKPGQTLQQFQLELKALTLDDRDYFKREFAKIGISIS